MTKAFEQLSMDTLEKILRDKPVPIIGRIENDRLLLDVRTLFGEDFEYIVNTIADVCK